MLTNDTPELIWEQITHHHPLWEAYTENGDRYSIVDLTQYGVGIKFELGFESPKDNIIILGRFESLEDAQQHAMNTEKSIRNLQESNTAYNNSGTQGQILTNTGTTAGYRDEYWGLLAACRNSIEYTLNNISNEDLPESHLIRNHATTLITAIEDFLGQ